MSVILVTGSSTGIGQEAALHMARKGHRVYASARTPETADELRDKITEEKLDAEIIRLDLLDPASIDEAVASIMAAEGRIDAVVNNAGIGGGRAVEETPMEEVREVFDTNYFGMVSVLRAVIPIMRKQGSGRIVNIGSLAGRAVMGCHGHYSAAKWALEGLSEAMALELAEFNVRVAVIEPGVTLTPALGKIKPPPADTAYGNSLAKIGRFFEFGMTRPAMPADVAVAIADAIESETPRFRYPVGPDAEEMIAAREKAGEEGWIEANRLQGEEYYDRMAELVGVDYYR